MPVVSCVQPVDTKIQGDKKIYCKERYVLSVEQIMTGISTQQKIYWKKD